MKPGWLPGSRFKFIVIAIKELIKQGVVFCGAGCALIFDTLVAQTVLDMKLHAALHSCTTMNENGVQ